MTHIFLHFMTRRLDAPCIICNSICMHALCSAVMRFGGGQNNAVVLHPMVLMLSSPGSPSPPYSVRLVPVPVPMSVLLPMHMLRLCEVVVVDDVCGERHDRDAEAGEHVSACQAI